MIAVRQVELREIATVEMGLSPKGVSYNRKGLGLPLLNGPTEFGPRHPSPRLYTDAGTRFAEPGDILFCVRGSTTGRMNWADQRYAIGRGIAAIRGPTDEETVYIRACLEVAMESLLMNASGSTFPNLGARDINGLVIPLHPARASIGRVVAAVDDLIENNRRRVALLEQMAQAIYREWFVHFRYPGRKYDELVDSPLGPIPVEWRVGTVDDICSRIQAGGTPSRSEPRYWNDPQIDWYKTGDLSDSALLGSSEQISNEAITESTARLFEPETILMAIYGSPTVGRLGLLLKESSCNQAALGLVANREVATTEYLWFALAALREHLNSLAQGAAQQNVSKAKVQDAPVLIPSRDVVSWFSACAGSPWRLSHSLAQQANVVARIRDAILPKLVTGAIDVSKLDLDALLEESAA